MTQTTAPFKNPTVQSIADFLNEIGIPMFPQPIEEETFLPGILIDRGKMLVDESKLLYPGDLLHEAGHIAVMTPEKRMQQHGNLTGDPNEKATEEMMAMCWSYAAACHLNLPASFVFHENGYKGESEMLKSAFESPTPIGLPVMEWLGMCYSEKRAAENNAEPFPKMISWLRA